MILKYYLRIIHFVFLQTRSQELKIIEARQMWMITDKQLRILHLEMNMMLVKKYLIDRKL